MSILRSRTMAAAVIAAMALLLVWFLPGKAEAATAEYPGGNQSTFESGNGGWTESAEYDGLCIPAVTCPQLSGSYQGSGGAAGSGDGHIRTNSGELTVAALLSTSTHSWTSPAFTYNGVGGKVPENLRFSVGVDPRVANLLQLGATVEVSARAIAVSGGGDQTLIDAVNPGSTPGWKTLNAQVGPGALELGKQYRIELSVAIGGLAAVLPSGSIGFDDVSLRATGPANGSGNGNGNGIGNGNGSGNTLPPPKVIPAGVAYFHKNRLYIRVKCPRAFKPRCRIQIVALAKQRRSRAATPVRRAYMRTGRSVRKVLGVKPGFRKMVRNRAKAKKRIVVRLKIRSNRGKKKATRFQRLRVVIRTR